MRYSERLAVPLPLPFRLAALSRRRSGRGEGRGEGAVAAPREGFSGILSVPLTKCIAIFPSGWQTNLRLIKHPK